jgi:16S rRNA (adenine1518-N6/adenine1519-N6)-dimethyltransferase
VKEIESKKLTLILGDVLTENIDITKPYSLIANIPYYITGAILERFLEHEPRPEKMVLLVQKEVAERIVARPEQSTRKSKESILSISVKVFGKPKIIAKVPPGAFTPPPTVDSAILAIENISNEYFAEILIKKPDAIAFFFKIVRAGFAHKRKLLKRNLEQVLLNEKIDNAWKFLNLDTKIRAEDLNPKEWVNILKETIN